MDRSPVSPPAPGARGLSRTPSGTRSRLGLALVLAAAMLSSACYVLRPSSGGGKASFSPPRRVDAADVALPPGYRIEPVATGLTFPSAVVFDDQDRTYVLEAGYSYGEEYAAPRLLRLEPDGKTTVIATGKNPPWTGVSFHQGRFYISEGGSPGRILRIGLDGAVTVLVDGLPGLADHHTNRPVIAPDGWLYFTQGTITNSGVVGPDNAHMGWLKREPQKHDIPCRDITLTGENFTSPNVLKEGSDEEATTGAYVPFGTATTKGQVIPGRLPCTGAVMRIQPDGGALEFVAWGLRNPYGLTLGPDGQLYVAENQYDVRGSRPVYGVSDYLWRLEPGAWYGWPDFAGGVPLSDKRFEPPGKKQPKLLLASHPQTPPRPLAYLGVHSSSSGLDISRSEAFGHVGEAFVAQFGDITPEVGKVFGPVGYKVVKVDLKTGTIEDFAATRGHKTAPASKLDNGGLERPVDVRFDNAGTALYVVDFGVITIHGKHMEPYKETGVVWRIVRDAAGSSGR